jgi:hypothetical protein
VVKGPAIQLKTFCSFQKSLEKRLGEDGDKVQDIEEKVNKMEDAGVLPRDGFAGTLNDRCDEVRKEQQNVNVSIEEAKPKYVTEHCRRQNLLRSFHLSQSYYTLGRAISRLNSDYVMT